MGAPDQRDSGKGAGPAVPPEIAAEAAVWIARLHGPDRSVQMEQECLAWQARSAVHRLAFERCTEVWEAVPRIGLADAYASASCRETEPGEPAEGRGRRSKRSRWMLLSAITLVVALGAQRVLLWQDGEVHITQVGEQQVLVLEDGTRMSLNTDTSVRVEMGKEHRVVSIQRGEALFEVAKDALRPFVVRVAGSEVEAVGTVFAVRLAGTDAPRGDALDVTLIEGQVTVRSASGAQGVAPAVPLKLKAGERIRLVKAAGLPASPALDRPSIEQMLAWKRSEADFDDVSLADAVAEMNRYSRIPIVLPANGALSQLRVSGLYRTGDSNSFAQAVAALHGLVVQDRDGRLELATPQ